MGADGHVIGFRVDRHVVNMIKGRIKQLEKVKEAMKNSKNPDPLKIDVDFNPIYPVKDRNPTITISFSLKDSVPSPSDTDAVSSGGAPAPSSSPPASVDAAPIELNAEPFYEIFDSIVSYLESYACFNQNLDVADEYIDDGVGFELEDFIDEYSGAWSYYDTESYLLPDDNFLVNICSEMYIIDDFDEDIEEIYDNVTPSEASKNTREIFLSLFPTWETMKYYFDEEMLIESDKMQIWT